MKRKIVYPIRNRMDYKEIELEVNKKNLKELNREDINGYKATYTKKAYKIKNQKRLVYEGEYEDVVRFMYISKTIDIDKFWKDFSQGFGFPDKSAEANMKLDFIQSLENSLIYKQ